MRKAVTLGVEPQPLRIGRPFEFAPEDPRAVFVLGRDALLARGRIDDEQLQFLLGRMHRAQGDALGIAGPNGVADVRLRAPLAQIERHRFAARRLHGKERGRRRILAGHIAGKLARLHEPARVVGQRHRAPALLPHRVDDPLAIGRPPIFRQRVRRIDIGHLPELPRDEALNHYLSAANRRQLGSSGRELWRGLRGLGACQAKRRLAPVRWSDEQFTLVREGRLLAVGGQHEAAQAG